MLGWIGQIFGHEYKASLNIAFISMFLGLAITVSCLLAAYNSPSDKDFWGKQSKK